MLEIIIPLIGFLIALGALVRGSSIFMEGATDLSEAFGMSHVTAKVFTRNFTLILPILAVSLTAVLNGTTSIAVANVVGSNVIGMLLIVGLCAFVGTGTVRLGDDVRNTVPLFAIATVLFFFVLGDGVLDRLDSLLLLSIFGAYIWHLVTHAADTQVSEENSNSAAIRKQSIGYIIGGLAALAIGAKISIDMVERFGEILQISVELLSLTVLALGTSIPLVLNLMRVQQTDEADSSVKDVLLMNTLSILLVLGIGGLVHPLTPGAITVDFGLPILMTASLILFVLGLSKRILRFESAILLILFAFVLLKVLEL